MVALLVRVYKGIKQNAGLLSPHFPVHGLGTVLLYLSFHLNQSRKCKVNKSQASPFIFFFRWVSFTRMESIHSQKTIQKNSEDFFVCTRHSVTAQLLSPQCQTHPLLHRYSEEDTVLFCQYSMFLQAQCIFLVNNIYKTSALFHLCSY